MSANICNDHHIVFLSEMVLLYRTLTPINHKGIGACSDAAINRAEFELKQIHKVPFKPEHTRKGMDERNEIIKEISADNFAAVNERYPENPIDKEAVRIMTMLRASMQMTFTEWDWLAVLDCIDCYEYQTNGLSYWRECKSFAYMAELRENVIATHISIMRSDRETCWGRPKFTDKKYLTVDADKF